MARRTSHLFITISVLIGQHMYISHYIFQQGLIKPCVVSVTCFTLFVLIGH
eukprot:m.57503 g.57503  ORF g.57503 m.57503 type:complete len:51 (+) comp11113_c0_seq1:2748-2900(+)